MRRILIGTFALIMALPAFAANDKTTTSVSYVGTALDAKQAKIPAANSAGAVAGSSVMTYTATSGTTGERALFTGGEYNASTDADKMITASALNSAITSLQTDTTSKLVCQNSPDCTLWIITDQTAYGAGSGSGGGASAETLAMLQALVGTNGTGYCYKNLNNGAVSAGTCTTRPSNYGDWGTMFTYNNEPVQISGTSRCDTYTSGGRTSGDCYCKMTYPMESDWVRIFSNSEQACLERCTSYCGSYLQTKSNVRSSVFGSVQ